MSDFLPDLGCLMSRHDISEIRIQNFTGTPIAWSRHNEFCEGQIVFAQYGITGITNPNVMPLTLQPMIATLEIPGAAWKYCDRIESTLKEGGVSLRAAPDRRYKDRLGLTVIPVELIGESLELIDHLERKEPPPLEPWEEPISVTPLVGIPVARVRTPRDEEAIEKASLKRIKRAERFRKTWCQAA